MPRYLLEENLSERIEADVEAPDPMAAYLMAPNQLEPGEAPGPISEADARTELWYGYRIWEVPADFPKVMEVEDQRALDAEWRKHPLVARIGKIDEEGW